MVIETTAAPVAPAVMREQETATQRSLQRFRDAVDRSELEVIWSGGEGLTSHRGGSSLGGVSSLAVGKV